MYKRVFVGIVDSCPLGASQHDFHSENGMNNFDPDLLEHDSEKSLFHGRNAEQLKT